MSDSLIPKFMQKLVELEKYIQNSKNDRKDIVQRVRKIQEWLASDRSLQQHRCCQSFLTYLYQSHGDKFKSRDGFISWLKCIIGFADIKVTKTKIKGETVIFKKYLPHSLSFGSCSQKKHQKFLDDLKNYAEYKWGINFDLWYEQWSINENTTQ